MKTSLFDIQVNGFAGVDFQQSDLTAADLRPLMLKTWKPDHA